MKNRAIITAVEMIDRLLKENRGALGIAVIDELENCKCLLLAEADRNGSLLSDTSLLARLLEVLIKLITSDTLWQ